MNKYDLASKAIRMYNSCTTFKHMQHTDKWVGMAEQDWDIDMSLEVNRARHAKIYELKRSLPESQVRWWNRLEHLKFRAAMFS